MQDSCRGLIEYIAFVFGRRPTVDWCLYLQFTRELNGEICTKSRRVGGVQMSKCRVEALVIDLAGCRYTID
jgi:hypothetical protein